MLAKYRNYKPDSWRKLGVYISLNSDNWPFPVSQMLQSEAETGEKLMHLPYMWPTLVQSLAALYKTCYINKILIAALLMLFQRHRRRNTQAEKKK